MISELFAVLRIIHELPFCHLGQSFYIIEFVKYPFIIFHNLQWFVSSAFIQYIWIQGCLISHIVCVTFQTIIQMELNQMSCLHYFLDYLLVYRDNHLSN